MSTETAHSCQPLYSGRMNPNRFRVKPGARRPLDAVPTDFTNGFDDKASALDHLQQRLPKERITSKIWSERFEDINAFERHLRRSGTTVVKFFLNISRREQEKRLLARIDDPTKNWKFSPGDLPERARWKAYMAAYQEAVSATSTSHAPWYVIPADHKWFAHAAIAEVLYDTLRRLDPEYPPLTP